MTPRISFNGMLVENLPWSEIGQGGFFYGRRVMTTMLVIAGRIIDFQRHYTRLCEDAATLGIADIGRPEVLYQEILGLRGLDIETNRYRTRLIFFVGATGQLNKIITSEAIDPTVEMGGEISLTVATDRHAQRGAHIKSGWLGSRALEMGRLPTVRESDILWLNGDQELTEATWANIFLIGRDGDLVEIATPAVSSGILPGIVRSRVIDLLNAAKIPVTVRVIGAEEIPRFDEAFLTSSVRCLQPISQIGRHKLHTMRPQSVFSNVCRLYNTWLTLDNDYDPSQAGPKHSLM